MLTKSPGAVLCVALVLLVATDFAVAADWFVAPNAKGGDGSRNKPFHDPYAALRAAESGDVIHVAAGVYYGRYGRSSWEIDRPAHHDPRRI